MTYVDSMGVEGRWLAGVRDAGDAAAATLTHKRLLDVHQAVIGAGLESQRGALLTGVPPQLRAQLPRNAYPSAQLLEDLDWLNGVGALDDGTYPIEIWIENAAALTASRPEAALFRTLLASLRRPDASDHLLLVCGGKQDGMRVYLREGTEHVVGRGRHATLLFPHDRTVSARHASLSVRGGLLTVKDLDSTHGVWLNGCRVLDARLATGDLLRCGRTELAVVDVDTPGTGAFTSDSGRLFEYVI